MGPRARTTFGALHGLRSGSALGAPAAGSAGDTDADAGKAAAGVSTDGKAEIRQLQKINHRGH